MASSLFRLHEQETTCNTFKPLPSVEKLLIDFPWPGEELSEFPWQLASARIFTTMLTCLQFNEQKKAKTTTKNKTKFKKWVKIRTRTWRVFAEPTTENSDSMCNCD